MPAVAGVPGMQLAGSEPAPADIACDDASSMAASAIVISSAATSTSGRVPVACTVVLTEIELPAITHASPSSGELDCVVTHLGDELVSIGASSTAGSASGMSK